MFDAGMTPLPFWMGCVVTRSCFWVGTGLPSRMRLHFAEAFNANNTPQALALNHHPLVRDECCRVCERPGHQSRTDQRLFCQPPVWMKPRLVATNFHGYCFALPTTGSPIRVFLRSLRAKYQQNAHRTLWRTTRVRQRTHNSNTILSWFGSLTWASMH